MANGSWLRLYGEHTGLVFGGAGVLVSLMVLSLVFVGYDVDWLKNVEEKEKDRGVVTLLSQFLTTMQAETHLRSAATYVSGAAAVVAARAATHASYGRLRSVFSGSADQLHLDTLYDDYSTAMTQISTLSAHVSLSAASAAALERKVRRELTARAKGIVDHLAVQQIAWRYAALMNQYGLMVTARDNSNGGTTAAEVSAVGRASVALTLALQTVDSPTSVLPVSSGLIAQIQNNFTSIVSTNPVTTSGVKTVTINSAFAANAAAYAYLSQRSAVDIPESSDSVRNRVIVFGVGAAIAFVSLVVCLVIIVRHIIATRRGRQLLKAFRDADGSKQMIAMYTPILQHMRVLELPAQPQNDVEKEFHIAAKLMLQLRPHVPQALFGDLNTRHKRKPNGAWDITLQNIRLEMSMAFCHCTVLTIAIHSTTLIHGTKDLVGAVLTESSMAYNAIVEEVNGAGGIVIGFSAGGRISCMWNATNIVEDAAFIAVKTARLIDKRLASMNIGRDLNVSSGNCVVANSKIGSRKHVTYVGGPFDVSEKLLLLNEGHVARLIIDYETFKELPREQQRTCKPIAVVSDRDDAPIVVMSADEEDALKGEQWKQYNTAFTLYQNNMLSESLAEFRKYLQAHPGDPCATWLIENVLEPKIGKRRSVTRLGGQP